MINNIPEIKIFIKFIKNVFCSPEKKKKKRNSMRIKLSHKSDIFNRNQPHDENFMKTTLDYSQFLISC